MAVRAHQVRLIAKLYRSQVRSCIVSVRIVTSSAAHLSSLETLRPLQSFHDEGGLTEAPVFVKADPGELTERNAGITREEPARARIVQLTAGARGTDRGLHVTLRTDADEIAVAQVVEIYRRVNRSLRIRLVCGHVHDMLRRRAVTHLAANARLFEFHIVHIEAAASYISELAGVANGADGLIAGGRAELLPSGQIAAFTVGAVNDFPIIDPPFLQCTVLDWKDMNLAAGQPGSIGLLEL